MTPATLASFTGEPMVEIFAGGHVLGAQTHLTCTRFKGVVSQAQAAPLAIHCKSADED